MPDSEINLDPDQGMRAGGALAVSGEQVLRVRQTTGGRIEAAHAARPWGEAGDALGDAFAKNYLETAETLLRVWQGAAVRATRLGDEVATAVRSTVAADTDAAVRLRQPKATSTDV